MADQKKSMTKKELISSINERLGGQYSNKEIEEILLEFEKVLLVEWKTKGEFKLFNIGKFKVINKKERNGINPLTKQPVLIPAKIVPKFSFTKAAKEFILGNLK